MCKLEERLPETRVPTSVDFTERIFAIGMRQLRSAFLLFALVVVVVSRSEIVLGQCSPHWLVGDSIQGTNGTVGSVAVMPDGSIAITGSFTTAGGFPARGVAIRDGIGWRSISDGLSGNAARVLALPGGDLVVSCQPSTYNGSIGVLIARWNGSLWTTLGIASGGSSPFVGSLALLQNGDVVVGGSFTTIDGRTCSNIARLHEGSWLPFGAGTDAQIDCVFSAPAGDLFIAGPFATIDGITVPRIARWNGLAWSPVGIAANLLVSAMTTAADGSLVVGGRFRNGTLIDVRVARWSGAAWEQLGANFTYPSSTSDIFITTLLTLQNGDFFVGGQFGAIGSEAMQGAAIWNGSTWTAPGNGRHQTIQCSALGHSGELVVGGAFNFFDQLFVSNVAYWSASQWHAFGDAPPIISSLSALPDGTLFAGGQIRVGTSGTRYVGRFDGVRWTTMEFGNSPGVSSEVVRSVSARAENDVIVGGGFLTLGGAPAKNVARWDGQNWNAMGSGLGDVRQQTYVWCLQRLPNGDIVAGGHFDVVNGITYNHIARWDGTTWRPMGTGLTATGDPSVIAVWGLALHPSGDLIAVGTFMSAGGVPVSGIARWNGTAWSAIGGGVGSAYAVAVLPNGNIVAGGPAPGGPILTYMAYWNGATWNAMGPGLGFLPSTATALPNGDIVVGGSFTRSGNSIMNRIARWNGSTWTQFGLGVDDGSVGALAVLPNGDLAVGGGFASVSGLVSGQFARYSFGNPPVITSQPRDVHVCRGGDATVTTGAFDTAAIGYRWQLQFPEQSAWNEMADGVLLDAQGRPCGVVAGSATESIRFAGLDSIGSNNFGHCRCIIVGGCGSITSQVVAITVCRGDFNCVDDIDLFDYLDFVDAFSRGDIAADFDRDGSVDFFDYLEYVGAFAAGC